MTSRWQDPTWQQSAYAWIERELDELGVSRTGRIEQPHVYVWSTVMRVPTDVGDVWFKANMASLRHEAVIAEIVSTRCPDIVPPLLALDPQTGWMLMADAGEPLREVVPREASLDRWLDVLARYASVQLELIDDVDDLLASGAPDLRLAGLPEQYERLVQQVDVEPRFRAAVPYVAELAERLATFGIPETIQHDDLHDGQVFIRDGSHLIMDWGDACVSHPFFTLSVTLEGMIAWGLEDEENSVDVTPFRDAYLAPFASRYAGDLSAAVETALRLGWVCRAVNGRIPGDDEGTLTRLRMFLDGRA